MTLLGFGMLSAQQNALLNADFWKSKPTVNQVKEKIAEGNDPTQLNERAYDPVSLAINNGAPNETIEYLLTLDGNGVDKRTHDKRTYLFWAGMRKNLPIAKLLIEKGADVNAVDSHFATPITFAAGTGNTDTAFYDLLINNGADIKYKNERGADALLLLIPHLKDLKETDYFIKKGLSLKAKDNDGNNAIFYAARNGNQNIINQLIKKKINPKALNNKGENLLFAAAEGARMKSNGLDFFQYIESLGINPNQANNDGLTPLFVLSQRHRDVAVINYFIDKGNDVNQTDKNGNNPLMNAAQRSTPEIISIFAEKTNNINLQNNEGHSALTNAVRSNAPEIVSLLLSKGADIQVKDLNGNSLTYYLVNSYSPRDTKNFDEKWAILSSKGLDFTTTQNQGNTLYHLAVDKGSLPLLEKVATPAIDINARNSEGLTALQKAAMTAKDTAILKFLIEKGADKSVTTDFDETVYDLAQENEFLKGKDIQFLK